MSTTVAILLVFALVVLILAPVAVAYRKPAARLPVAAVYGVLLSGLALYHTGTSFARVVPLPGGTATPAGEVSMPDTDEVAGRCTEALEMADKGSIIRDRSNLGRVVVAAELWNQLPDMVKQGLVRCLEIAAPADQADVTVQIVEQ